MERRSDGYIINMWPKVKFVLLLVYATFFVGTPRRLQSIRRVPACRESANSRIEYRISITRADDGNENQLRSGECKFQVSSCWPLKFSKYEYDYTHVSLVSGSDHFDFTN